MLRSVKDGFIEQAYRLNWSALTWENWYATPCYAFRHSFEQFDELLKSSNRLLGLLKKINISRGTA